MYLRGWDFVTRHPSGTAPAPIGYRLARSGCWEAHSAAGTHGRMTGCSLELDAVYVGDCLDVMCRWPQGFVDLCYLEPPFDIGTGPAALFGKRRPKNRSATIWVWDEAAAARVDALQRHLDGAAHDVVMGLHIALGDCGMVAFVSYMAERLIEIKRVLRPAGSVCLHCAPVASHYLKVVMDGVFGPRNFRGEIGWRDSRSRGGHRQGWRGAHQSIFWYSNGPEWTFNRVEIEPPETGTGNAGDGGERTPLALLERIVRAGSNPGDVVLDPFCVAGNCVIAARNLGRKWLGVGFPKDCSEGGLPGELARQE